MMVALLWIFYLIICRLSPDDIKHVRVHLSNKTAALATSAANMAPLSTAAIIWWKYHLKISSPIKAITFLCQEHTSKMHESVEYTQDILSYYWQVGVDRRNCSIFFFIPSMIRNRNKSRSCQIFQDLEYSANFQIKWRKLWILANTFTHYWMILRNASIWLGYCLQHLSPFVKIILSLLSCSWSRLRWRRCHNSIVIVTWLLQHHWQH